MRHSPAGTKWCHIVCSTSGRREVFKIAAHGRFCERAIRDGCTRIGWSVDAITVQADSLQLLALVPADLARDAALERLRRLAGAAATRVGATRGTDRRLWDSRGWCAVLSNAAKVEAVRRHIERRAGQAAHLR